MNLFLHSSFQPMLLSEVKEPFDDENYFFEMKFDGMRAVVFASPKSVRIQNRHGKDVTSKFLELQKIKDLVDRATVFDGEIVCFQDGKPNFSMLQKRILGKNEAIPVVFVCFDLLYDGKDLTRVPLEERKKILDKFRDTDYFVKTFFVVGNGKKFFRKIVSNQLEGMVAKKRDSLYFVNTRSLEWIKVKYLKREWFVIGGYGYTVSKSVFSLYLGEYKDGKLIYVGKVFVSRKNELFVLLTRIERKKCSFKENNFSEEVHFVALKWWAEVEFLERGLKGGLRHPVFIRFKKALVNFD